MAFTILAMPTLAVSEPIVDIKTDYYLVSGKTASGIRNNLNMKTPIREGGIKYDARTDCFVKWNFWWNEYNGLCTITKVKTSVDVQYVLPKLDTSIFLPKSLKRKWGTYMKALLQHEGGHKDLGVRAANEIEKKIGNMAARSSCKQLEIDANRIGDKILEKFRDLEKEFDSKSNHGTKDGAVFP